MRKKKVTFTDNVLLGHFARTPFSTPTSLGGKDAKWMRRVMREIALLSTSLPEGIFVKVAEGRCDLWEVLMVGVKDTPYEGGLFP